MKDRTPEPPNDEGAVFIEAVHGVRNAVDALPAKLKPATPGQFEVTAAPQATHVKMRTSFIVISPAAAGAVALNIGFRVWVFTFAGAVPIMLPFVQLVDRGVDIWMPIGAAGITTAYLIYTPE